jgi:hypothetical protein
MDSESHRVNTKELEARMRPGALSEAGFLGVSERLDEVLTRDARTLKNLDIGYREISGELDRLINRAEAAPDRSVQVGNFEVTVKVFPGFQMCPWSPDIHRQQCAAGGGVRHASVNWHIRNLRAGREMKGPGLIVHLIRDHRFFEGFESPYRTDPDELARLLELGPYRK